MTWLFTQVWLWSLAAFLLGSVITWLLFVRPAHRRLGLAREELADLAHGRYPDETSSDPRERDHEHTMWDMLDSDVDDPEPSPDRPFRTSRGEASGYWSLRAGSPWERDAAEEERSAERTRRPDFADASGETAPAGGEEEVRQQADDSDIRMERQRESAGPDVAAGGASPPPAAVWPQPQPQQPMTPPEVEPAVSASTEQHPNRNTWFSNDEAAAHGGTRSQDMPPSVVDSGPEQQTQRWQERPQPDDSGEPMDPPGGENLTGKLRSLFEPNNGGGAETDGDRAPTRRNGTNGTSAQSPPFPPRDAADRPTGELRAVDSERSFGEETIRNGVAPGEAETESTPLPRRVPGATNRPGTPPGDRPDLEATAEHPAAPAKGGPGGAPAASDEPAWPGTAESAGGSEANAPAVWEWYPDEPYGSQEQPDEGYTVKGHFASRQYHTSESPYFERVAAEVWFRTPAEAEQAGFEPWDGRSRG